MVHKNAMKQVVYYSSEGVYGSKDFAYVGTSTVDRKTTKYDIRYSSIA